LKRILVVDDEPQITRMLRASLQSSGYEVLIANNGTQAYERLIADRPDLVITDLAMPEMNGIELTQAIRGVSQIPIIVLSVRDSDQMKVLALDEGADDYLTKPFSVPELLARVRAQLRRGVESQSVLSHIELGDFVIDTEAHSVLIRNQPVHLTPKEFDLLVVFARSPERVLTHKVLLRAVWGPAGDGQPEYLRVLIAQLRKKIEHGDSPQYILSEPWIGYRFDPSGPVELTTS
jgi:two-component system KDP operon response regulator KdpE